jgi:hypothetical protein
MKMFNVYERTNYGGGHDIPEREYPDPECNDQTLFDDYWNRKEAQLEENENE